jgi:hypothetical protein
VDTLSQAENEAIFSAPILGLERSSPTSYLVLNNMKTSSALGDLHVHGYNVNQTFEGIQEGAASVSSHFGSLIISLPPSLDQYKAHHNYYLGLANKSLVFPAMTRRKLVNNSVKAYRQLKYVHRQHRTEIMHTQTHGASNGMHGFQ